MSKSILCSLNVHQWTYSTETRLFLNIDNGSYVRADIFRACDRCHIKQKFYDEAELKVSPDYAEGAIAAEQE